jgi:hypothetical protein
VGVPGISNRGSFAVFEFDELLEQPQMAIVVAMASGQVTRKNIAGFRFTE